VLPAPSLYLKRLNSSSSSYGCSSINRSCPSCIPLMCVTDAVLASESQHKGSNILCLPLKNRLMCQERMRSEGDLPGLESVPFTALTLLADSKGIWPVNDRCHLFSRWSFGRSRRKSTTGCRFVRKMAIKMMMMMWVYCSNNSVTVCIIVIVLVVWRRCR